MVANDGVVVQACGGETPRASSNVPAARVLELTDSAVEVMELGAHRDAGHLRAVAGAHGH
jgi:hypothetical protein